MCSFRISRIILYIDWSIFFFFFLAFNDDEASEHKRMIWSVQEFFELTLFCLLPYQRCESFAMVFFFLILSVPFIAIYKIPQFVQSFRMRLVYEVAIWHFCVKAISCLTVYIVQIYLYSFHIVYYIYIYLYECFSMSSLRNYCDQN